MGLNAQVNLPIPEDVHKAIVFCLNSGIKSNEITNEKIDKALVHKNKPENVVISHPVILDEKNKIYRTKVLVDQSHNFFFDHQLRHLPGMLLLEAARQFGTAISHLFFDAPYDSQFILHDLGSQFVAGAEVGTDVFIDVMIIDVKIKNGKLRKMSGVGYVHQNSEIIGKITSSWSIIPAKVVRHLTRFH